MEGSSQGQNTMPRHTNGVRSGSSKRSTSDQTREQELRPVNGLDVSHSNSEEPPNPAAVLASYKGPLQRLANIARFIEVSFSQDITIVEGDYGPEMDRENEIQRLTGVVETLIYAKDERLEDLRHEIEELKASEEYHNREREKYQAMRTELEEQHTQKEAEREQKLQKSVRTKIAEIEARSKEKTQVLENKIASLSAKNEKLEESLAAAEEKLKNKKIKHDRLEKSLEGENEQLKVELQQQLCKAIEALSLKFFRELPERAILDPDTVREELSKLNPIFASTPIWDSPASEFLRLRAVQHVISTSLCDFIWHPFFPQDSPPVAQFLEAVSKSLSVSGGRSESAWRVLTLRGINAVAAAGMVSRHVDSTVNRILEILQPLITLSQLGELKHTLVNIIKESITLWTAAQKDVAKVVVEARPNPSDSDKWYAEDLHTAGETSTAPIGKIDLTRFKPFCIFPNIIQFTSPNKSVVLHRGSAVFPTSRVWIRGMLEQKVHDEELEKEMLAVRSKVNARRTSGLTSPNSPKGGNFSTTQK